MIHSIPAMVRILAALALKTAALAAPAAPATPASSEAGAAADVPSPREYFGHVLGADRTLVSYDESLPYLELVAERSDRVDLVRLGKTTEGRDLVLLVVSTPGNLARQARYREIAARLDDPRGLSAAGIDSLVAEGKVILLVTLNIHSTEIAVGQVGMEWLYDLADGGPDTEARYLEDVILLLVPNMNPDGQVMVTEWYRETLGTPYEGSDPPRLYHRYAGHDNNRDWFMLNLTETRLLNRAVYHGWHPQVLLDEHQMGPSGPRVFVPPYADPVSDRVHPLIHRGALLIGAGMAMDLEQAGKAGVIYGYSFDAYWPGGTRSTPWWKNTVGILTEIASARLMTPIYVDPGELMGGRKGLPEYQAQVNFPNPWPGGWWRPRDIVEYARILSGSALETCALHREDFLRNRALMAKEALHRGETGPPYGYVIAPHQHDPGTAAKLVDLLRENGVEVHRSPDGGAAGEQPIPPRSFVVRAAQPLRSFVLEMLEPQAYPEVKVGVNSDEIHPPYDVTSWCLPDMMGVAVTRLDAPIDAPLEPVETPAWDASLPPSSEAAAWVLTPRENDAYTAVLRLLSRGKTVRQTRGGDTPGEFLVTAPREEMRAALEGLRASPRTEGDVGPRHHAPAPTTGDSAAALPPRTLHLPRVGLYQSWLASMDEGWTRFVLDDFEVPYTLLHNRDIETGGLRRSLDVIVIPDLGRREIVEGKTNGDGGDSDVPLPPAYAGGVGEKGVRALEEFVRAGGTLVTLGSAADLAIQDLRVPVRNLTTALGRRDFYTPGTMLRVAVDSRHPLGYGMPAEALVYHVNDPVLGTQLPGPAASRDVVARFVEGPSLVAGGWSRGAQLLERKPALIQTSLGRGRVVIFAFRPQHRGQTHGTYRLLLNALLDAAAD